MSAAAAAWARECTGLTDSDHKLVLLIIADGTESREGLVIVSVKDLAESCIMDEARALECLATLEEQGFITVLRRTAEGSPGLLRLNLASMPTGPRHGTASPPKE